MALLLRAKRRAALSLDDGLPRFNLGLDVAKLDRYSDYDRQSLDGPALRLARSNTAHGSQYGAPRLAINLVRSPEWLGSSFCEAHERATHKKKIAKARCAENKTPLRWKYRPYAVNSQCEYFHSRSGYSRALAFVPWRCRFDAPSHF